MTEFLSLHQSIHGGLFFIFSVLLPMCIGLGLARYMKRVISAVLVTTILTCVLGYGGLYLTHVIHTHNSYHLNPTWFHSDTNIIEIPITE